MNLLELVKSRRSIRKFQSEPIDKDCLLKIVEFGRWAPSGLNNQPWKLIGVMQRDILDKLAECTTSSHVLKSATAALVVFLDKSKEYNYAKDCQGIGALIQNLLLAIHFYGLGSCWLGQILNKTAEVNKIMKINGDKDKLELMAVIAIGKPEESEFQKKGTRKEMEEIFEFFE